MLHRRTSTPGTRGRRAWPTPSIFVAGAALFIALGGTAVAAGGLVSATDLARNAVTSKAIKNGAIKAQDLNASAKAALQGGPGATGATGTTGAAGANGTNGANGVSGINGANGPNGANGIDGDDGLDGTDGIDGTDGTDGIDGTIEPLSASNASTALPGPAGTPPTEVVSLSVPAGSYVLLAKTQLSHTGAGDSITCVLFADGDEVDRIAMRTLPALAAIPASLQAVTTTAATADMSLECDVLTANGSADSTSLIAIPTG